MARTASLGNAAYPIVTIIVPRIIEPITLTPKEYELAVKGILDGTGISIRDYKSSHREAIDGIEGRYVIDVTARFTALGADFLVLVECKHERRKVERHDVQVLHSKVQSAGAQKGMLFSVSGFQNGAIKYADIHGIALVQLASGRTAWFTKSLGPSTPPPSWVSIPDYVGWWHHGNSMSAMSTDHGEYTRVALGLKPKDP